MIQFSKYIALTLALTLSQSSYADNLTSRVSKGDLLKQRQYRTTGTGALTFYVDPLGNDANQCTATGTDACLTLKGALGKAPKQLRDLVTINVAAGNYTGAAITGFTMDSSVQTTNGGLLINGTQATVTPATGAGTGTATSGSAGSGTTYGTLTDSTQTWTVNDLRGKFIAITGGTGSGQVKVVVSNTIDTITIAGSWTAPTGTSTYAIQSPSSIITVAAPAVPDPIGGSVMVTAALQIFNNNMINTASSGGAIVIKNMTFASGGTRMAGVGSGVDYENCLFSGAGTTGLTNGAKVIFTATSFTTSNLFTSASFSQLSFISSYVATTVSTSNSRVDINGTHFKSGFTGQAALNFGGGSGVVTASRCDCASGATTSCISTGPINATTATVVGSLTINGLDVTNCTSGVIALNGGTIAFNPSSTFSGNGLTYAARADYGGRIILPSAITITAGTAELAIDNGALTDSFASLAAAFSCLSSMSTTSAICRQ